MSRRSYAESGPSASMMQRASNSYNMPGAYEDPDPEEVEDLDDADGIIDEDLPQCKIKRNYACPQCDFFTQNPRTYLYHLRDDHQARIKVYECPKCVYASKHSQKLQRHIHMVHVLGKQRQQHAQQQAQQQMQSRKPSPPPFLQPQQEMYEEDESDVDPPVLEEEGELEDLGMAEEEPVGDHQPGEQFQCSLCPFKSYSVTLVQRHETIAHLKKKFFRCTKCNYVTHLKARFTKHVKYHSMPMIKCDLCDFRTPYKWNLDRHYRNHQGDGEFKCPLCNFRADIKQSLTVHVQNHHLTPQQKALRGVNRRNKVGGSDAPSTELRMSDVGLVGTNPGGNMSDEDEEEMEQKAEMAMQFAGPSKSQSPIPSTSGIKKKTPVQKSKGQTQPGFSNSDFVHPDDILHKNGKVYYKNLKCNYCPYKAFWEGDIARHEAKHHGVAMPVSNKQVKKRPIPNLIPLQQTSPTPSDSEMSAASFLAGGHSIFGGPSIIAQSDDEQQQEISDHEYGNGNASTMEENFPSERDSDAQDSTSEKSATKTKIKKEVIEEHGTSSDEMGDKGSESETQELKCDTCGHESKTLPEAAVHQKTHKREEAAQRSFLGTVGLSSTRCQHCRERFNTSGDLMVHLQACPSKEDGAHKLVGSADEDPSSDQRSDEEISGLQCASCRQPCEDFEELKAHVEVCKSRHMDLTPEVSITEMPAGVNGRRNIKPSLTIERIPGSNARAEEDESKLDSDDEEPDPRRLDFSEVFIGIETAPGYGVVTEEKVSNPQESKLPLTKVFKCPQCNFWASAASRFHIHLVGHLNSKPFGCSQCDYRSNWRWDVAKHIRLKGARDALHAPAARPRVLVTDDDTSRRNYSKYAKYVMYLVVQPGPEMEAMAQGVSNGGKSISPNSLAKSLSHKLQQSSSALTISRVTSDASRNAKKPMKRPAPPELTPQQKSATSAPPNKRLLWRCKKCNYRGADKEQVLEHVRRHYTNPQEKPMPMKSPPSNNQKMPNISEKFNCKQCPFVGEANEADGHIVNHKPFPAATYKCLLCPYFVKNRDGLCAHLGNAHGIDDPRRYLLTMKILGPNFFYKKPPEEPEPPVLTPNMPDTSKMREVPLVWTMYGNGKVKKQFKCRFCPHTNSRKVNIVEHEKMHSARSNYPESVFHTCTQCNYSCNNAGVLSAHIKVHQDWYPKSVALYDPARTDLEQVKDIGGNEFSFVVDENESRESSPAPQTETDSVTVTAPGDAPGRPDEKDEDDRLLYFCRQCPARFLFSRELAIHRRFHRVKLQFHCGHCNYTARQPQHLAAHNKVHCSEYQDRTALLLMSHQESDEHPKPALVVRDDAWVVLDPDDVPPVLKQQVPVDAEPSGAEASNAIKQHCCHLCPARFFKAVALQYHITLHGGAGPYKCSKCDYAVKMYGNLVRHEVVHDEKENESELPPPAPIVQMSSSPSPPPPLVMSRQMPQLQQQQMPQLPQVPDPVFGTLMHGNPDFVYPTYWKNGKLKEKRYKCHKCPSAFEKREQYKVHLGLHGSKQKYNCERCDYSVKYYANFIQHQKKHENNDRAHQEQQQQMDEDEDEKMLQMQQHQQQLQMQMQMQQSGPEVMEVDDEEDDDVDDEVMKVLHEPEVVLVTKPVVAAKTAVTASVQRQQQQMVLERRKLHGEPRVEQQITAPTFWCSSCPYNNQRRDLVEAHLKRHQQHSHTDTSNMHLCCYCDYFVPHPQQLKEHMLLHFRVRPLPNSRRAVTFTKYDQLEIWSTRLDQEEEAKSQVVCNVKSADQKLPDDSDEEEEDDDDVQFIDLRTGEPVEDEKRPMKDQAMVAA